MLRFSGAGVSDVGRVRPHNEDSGFVGPYVALVADGVGGAAAGEIASATAAYAASARRARPARAAPGARPRRGATPAAATASGSGVQRDLDRLGMATTLTMVVTDGRTSRSATSATPAATCCATASCARSPRDHTYVQHLVDTGQLSAEARATHPWRNVVLRSVDGDPEGGGLDVVRLDVRVGDRLLLCSDGLTDLVDDARIAGGARAPRSRDEAAADADPAGAGRRRPRQHHLRGRRPRRRAARGRRRHGCSARCATPATSSTRPRSACRGLHRLTACATLRGVTNVERPALEGTVAVRDGRRLSFAEYGSPRGAAIIWMHGTPGARRQIPLEARRVRRRRTASASSASTGPGIGSSTPHLYGRIGDWTGDLELLLDALAIDTCRLIGLSGGGPYVLAAGANLPERVHGVGVLGGVVPTRGPDAADGGIIQLAVRLAPLLQARPGAARRRAHRRRSGWSGRSPAPALDLYAAVQPPGDKNLLSRPGVQGDVPRRPAQRQPVPDLGAAQRPAAVHPRLGLHRRRRHRAGALVARRRRPHRARSATASTWSTRLPDATLTTIDGESHLGGLGHRRGGHLHADGARAAPGPETAQVAARLLRTRPVSERSGLRHSRPERRARPTLAG